MISELKKNKKNYEEHWTTVQHYPSCISDL